MNSLSKTTGDEGRDAGTYVDRGDTAVESDPVLAILLSQFVLLLPHLNQSDQTIVTTAFGSRFV